MASSKEYLSFILEQLSGLDAVGLNARGVIAQDIIAVKQSLDMIVPPYIS